MAKESIYFFWTWEAVPLACICHPKGCKGNGPAILEEKAEERRGWEGAPPVVFVCMCINFSREDDGRGRWLVES